jgi:hypothetical protein
MSTAAVCDWCLLDGCLGTCSSACGNNCTATCGNGTCQGTCINTMTGWGGKIEA